MLHTAESGAQIVTLYGPDATKANVDSHLRDIAKQAKADDTVILTMIGHGSFDETDYKFNLPGPDQSAIELSGMLDKDSLETPACGEHDQRQRRIDRDS